MKDTIQRPMLPTKTFTTILLFAMCAASAAGREAQSTLQEQLIEADRGIWEAMAESRPNIEKVSAALAQDYLDVDSGIRHSRGEALEYLRGLTKFSFQYGSAHAYVLSSTCGYVIAELSYSSVQNGNSAAGKVLTTSVFRKEHGRWMAHLHTEMDIKPEAH